MEFREQSYHRFTQSLYRDRRGNILIDQDRPILQNPNQSLNIQTKKVKVDGVEHTRVVIRFTGAIDNRELDSAILSLKVNGEIYNKTGEYKEDAYFFNFDVKGEIKDWQFEQIIVEDRAGNRSKHYFPANAEVNIERNGDVKFSGDLTTTARELRFSTINKKTKSTLLKPDQINIQLRKNPDLSGSVFEVTLDGIDLDDGDGFRLSWSDLKSGRDPIRHSLMFDKNSSSVSVDENGRVTALVHFPKRVSKGRYRLSSISVFKPNEKRLDYYIDGNKFAEISPEREEKPKRISKGEIIILNPTNNGKDGDIQFDLAIPDRGNISSIGAIVRYGREEINLIGNKAKQTTIDGKKYLVYRLEIPSVSAEVILKKVKVYFDDYSDGLLDDQSGLVPIKAQYQDPDFEINLSQRIIIINQKPSQKE
jgi:hypothetical protein